MLNFRPIGSYKDIEKEYIDRLNRRKGSRISREDVVDALKTAGRRLKELTEQTRLENSGYLLELFDYVRVNIDIMADSVQLDEKGNIVKVWNPRQCVPKYTDFVSGIIQDRSLPFVFHPQDDQIFFADRDMEAVRTATGFEHVDIYGRLQNTEPIYTFFTKPETTLKLTGNGVAFATVAFVEDRNKRQSIAIVRNPPLLISRWEDDLELKCPVDKKAEKISIPESHPEFVTGTFVAYQEKMSKEPTAKPLVVCYRRIDRCNFE